VDITKIRGSNKRTVPVKLACPRKINGASFLVLKSIMGLNVRLS
jgi:hypothetical protein